MKTIKFEVENINGERQQLELPDDINLSLMEVLKGSDYPIAATCGGMALCATCHIEILEGEDKLGIASDVEMDMIDTLPNATNKSRLACQIRLDERLDGGVIRIKGDQ